MMANKLEAYADASYDYHSGFCGYSFLILQNQKVIHNFSGLACANSSANAELLAVIRVFEYLVNTRKSKTNSKLTVEVFIDCLPIVKKSMVKQSSDYLFNYLESLRDKFKQSNITWIKGHSGNRFNTLVDKRARKILRDYIEKTFYL